MLFFFLIWKFCCVQLFHSRWINWLKTNRPTGQYNLLIINKEGNERIKKADPAEKRQQNLILFDCCNNKKQVVTVNQILRCTNNGFSIHSIHSRKPKFFIFSISLSLSLFFFFGQKFKIVMNFLLFFFSIGTICIIYSGLMTSLFCRIKEKKNKTIDSVPVDNSFRFSPSPSQAKKKMNTSQQFQ
jgi:hypothetical protein